MNDPTKMGNVPGIPIQEPNQMPYNDPGQHSSTSEPIPTPPPPGTSVPPSNEANHPEERHPQTPTTPTGLRDFEGRRLYFANVCSTVSPHALHCIFRSYGPIRTFHYDTTLHYGYVVYLEREQALLARYGIDGLILGSRAIRVYYPPFKPRHPTRYCYNCREMGHFIQSCPYTHYNNWDYSYSQHYNQGQPVIDHMNHPSSPMMHHFAGHMVPPTPQFMFPTAPVSTIPGQPPGSATLLYQPGWPAIPTTMHSMPFMPPFMGPQPPMSPGHPPMTPHHPVVQQQMHLNHQLMSQQAPHHPHIQQPMPPQPMPIQPPHPQLHPNINAMIQEQATAIIQQHLTPMVQQVVTQIMQDPAVSSLQHGMVHNQNLEAQNLRSGSYTVKEEPECASVQSGSMTMQHGSYTTMEEPVNPPNHQNVLAQLMQNLPMQDSDSEYMDLGKMMQFAAQSLLQDQYAQRNEDCCSKESASSRPRCVHEMEEDMSPRPHLGHPIAHPEHPEYPSQQNQRSVNCCPVHNTPLTKVQKPAITIAQQLTGTKTTTIHNGSTTTPRQQQCPIENMPPPESQTRDTSSTESRPNVPEQPMQPVENQYYPQYPYQPPTPFSLPSSIFFTLPPIVVNITSPAAYMGPTEPITEPKATFPPPYDTLQKNIPENYEFMQENERNFREFEEVVQDDEQNYVENERNLRGQQTEPPPDLQLDQPGPSAQPEPPKPSTGATPRPPKQASNKPPPSKRTLKIVRSNGPEEAVMVYEQSPQISERERQRQDRLKLRAMLMDGNDHDYENNASAMIPINQLVNEAPSSSESPFIYSELISTMNTSCSEIEKLFMSLSNLVGNPLAKKCLDQIRTKSETEILKLSQQLLHQIVDKDKPTDKEEILKLSNDLLAYANQKLPSTSAEPICEGAVGGVRNPDEVLESSRSECDSRKDDSDDGNYKRKNHWKKNKKRRR